MSSYDEEDDSEQTNKSNASDLAGKVQAIRSKFKLLTIQLRWTSFSLKDLMDRANQPKGGGAISATETQDFPQSMDW
jgi:hypothetical protein